ncbi:MAG: cell division protein FtsZ [Deltaproteobacteria bacterium]|nr:cell division protein FtsZ [Deltaproteobacteria bacterium]
MFELVEQVRQGAKIKVIGVGGAGGNAINTMIRDRLEGVDFIAANTDLQALKTNGSPQKIQLGRELTKGLGAGANPEIGKQAALEDQRAIADSLMGADMVFITAGMGGGTGTGAAPVVAKIAKECGALSVAVVTKPFAFEGKRRARLAEEGIAQLREAVDTLITIPNEKLVGIAGKETTVLATFKMADEVLLHAVKGISDLITVQGLINLDFADVRTVMNEMGMALMGTGIGTGENRAIDAATKAISSPLLENVSIRGATGLLINITGGPNMTLHEVHEASKLIQEEAHEDANIIFGAVIDESLTDELRVTVIATGFNRSVRGAVRSRAVGIKPGSWTERAPNEDAPGDGTQPVARPLVYPTPPVERPEAALRLSVGEERPTTVGGSWTKEQAGRPFGSPIDLREIMAEIGLPDQREDEYDIPTFLRKQAD